MQEISKVDLKQMNEVEHEDFVLLNVLPREQFNKEHIRTSVNVPLADPDFSDVVHRIVGDKDRKVVVYCANHSCDASPKAAKRLEDAGFDRVYDYVGGTEDWHS